MARLSYPVMSRGNSPNRPRPVKKISQTDVLSALVLLGGVSKSIHIYTICTSIFGSLYYESDLRRVDAVLTRLMKKGLVECQRGAFVLQRRWKVE